ncbi:ABC transporter permease [Acidimangrovimonas sediminis]|uniref:ABC transporter permease n=1 Tax=Acidimangrovimonas sediminis TaxID=2056283 RepID=UPI000C7F7D63|nr:ABC transporter permease subunit [Acidimangrovimonas sediminis]
MLIWSRAGRAAVLGVTALVVLVLYAAPLAIIVLAAFAGQWNGVWPSQMGLGNFTAVFQGAPGEAVWASLVTGLAASAVALVSGTAAALALRGGRGIGRRALDLLFFLPSAVPSVSVGLALLVAFSRPPVLLNGTALIVVIAHFVIVSAFAFGAVSAGLMQLPRDVEQMAESLGASAGYRLRRVTLPLLLPYLAAAFGLSVALSMGELGATSMLYPPGWVTMPVSIFALTDRGDVFEGSALTVILIAATLVHLALVQLATRGGRAGGRRSGTA